MKDDGEYSKSNQSEPQSQQRAELFSVSALPSRGVPAGAAPCSRP